MFGFLTRTKSYEFQMYIDMILSSYSFLDMSTEPLSMTDQVVKTSNFSLLSIHHHFLFSWKEWLVDPAEQFYYLWLQVMILPIVYNWVIIILRYKHGIWWISNNNHISKHITSNQLTSFESKSYWSYVFSGHASLQLHWTTCLCGLHWTICQTSCI